jgi:arylsulfatase A-like enzyme
MVSAVDDGVGQLTAKLRELDLERDTLIFFLSDNGGPPTANASRNDPLRGAKGMVYEGGIRVPFVIQWKGKLKEGTTYEEPVTCLDILPTAAAIAGAKLPSGVKPDGVNLLPYLLGESKEPPHKALFWRAGGGDRWAVRQGRYKLLQEGDHPPELYDLQADIAESKDLASAQPERVASMRQHYQAWNAELMAPLWQNPQRKPVKSKPPAAAPGR